MSRKISRARSRRPESDLTSQQEAVSRKLAEVFTAEVVDELRTQAGYNPRQRVVTAKRLMLVVVEAFLMGHTLGFAALRALFVRRFQFVGPCPFQQRFKQPAAGEFFRLALQRLVDSVARAADIRLAGPLERFEDVRIYDGTGQRVPPRGRKNLPACGTGKAGAKWVWGYSIKSGLMQHGACASATASEQPLWRSFVPRLAAGVLYLVDLGYFERALFAEAQAAGAHLLTRLKSSAKPQVIAAMDRDGVVTPVNPCSPAYFIKYQRRRRGTTFDLDVRWGRGRHAVELRLVGYAHKHDQIRWYLTTVPRAQLSAREVVETYRLRWLIELLFRELKQNADIGRSMTADPHAIQALTYGAILAHVVVRSLRIQACLAGEVSLEQLRPLACLHVVRAHATALIDALQRGIPAALSGLIHALTRDILHIAYEHKPSRSRRRIARELGAYGA